MMWPLPGNYSFDGGVLSLVDTGFEIVGNGAGQSSPLLKRAFQRYKQYFFYQGKGSATSGLKQLTVYVEDPSENQTLDTEEAYGINLSKDDAHIGATSLFGALRALETFSQLIFFNNGEYKMYGGYVGDIPRFNHRGFLMDTSRHYVPVPTILQFLDAMSFNKMNVFHWHIVDDQSFPYVSTTYPDLSKAGAYDQNHLYTQDDVKNVIAYAKDRGIRVIPEFDSPGHSLSWGKGQPGLSTPCYDNSTGKPTGSYGPIDPTNAKNWEFLEGLFKELSTVFEDQYLHIGGDEVRYKCWTTNPNIWKWMEAHNITGDYAQLEQYYETKLLNLVGSLGKSYVVWEEIFDNGLQVKNDTVIEVWKSNQQVVAKVTAAGLRAIYSTCWYLNYISYSADWENYYRCDPMDFDGTDQQKSLVVGGEACVWGEFVDATNLVSRAWPRAGAVAERLWSPQYITDLYDARIRLHNQRCRMIRRGIDAQPFYGPSYCPDAY
jgi:hexosaminidase